MAEKRPSKKVVVIRLNPFTDDFYKDLAKKQKMSKSELIRQVLEQYERTYQKS